jgi:branched-chain amino acid transport system ATP-binding protein
LQDLDLSVENGEIVAVLGANAAGKTTMLRAISGVVVRSSGTVEFDGKPIQDLPGHRRVERGLVQVPESRRLFPQMSVRENLEMGAYLDGPRAKLPENMEKVLDLFPILGERIGQRAGTLSGGEQQMLAIGRALMAKPQLLLLDEPSLGLAPLVVNRIFDVIRRLKESGVTILLVEQNARKALAVADRAYVLETGLVGLSGPAAELARDPAVEQAYLGDGARA